MCTAAVESVLHAPKRLPHTSISSLIHTWYCRVRSVRRLSPSQLFIRPSPHFSVLVRVIAETLIAIERRNALHVFRVECRELAYVYDTQIRSTAEIRTRSTYVDVFFLMLHAGALWYGGDAPCDVPCKDNLSGRDLVFSCNLNDCGITEHRLVSCQQILCRRYIVQIERGESAHRWGRMR